MRIINLKPHQTVTLFGWFNLKPFISWDDVVNSRSITFRSMRNIGLSSAQLYTMQPDASQWKHCTNITLHDCLEMTQWPMHPINDLNADLGDILSMHWTPDQMIRLGITLDGLMCIGMGSDLMCMFGYPLTSWIHLGLTRKHVDSMTDADIRRVFLISRGQVLASDPSFTRIGLNPSVSM
jgi:hypothetical protein